VNLLFATENFFIEKHIKKNERGGQVEIAANSPQIARR
jgi:hypothetical protein